CSVAKTPVLQEQIDCDIAQEVEADYKVEKLGDPGPLNLQVEIRGKVFDDCLCDLGASVNLMSYTAAIGLGLCSFEPTNVSLRFADSSEKKPLGVVVDLPVKVDKVTVPTDFVVLELEDRSRETIILGRPFLNTTGAVINTREGSVTLDLRQKSRNLSERKHTIDPGDTGVSRPTDDAYTLDPRALNGEAEWLKIRRDREMASSMFGYAEHLRPKPPLEGNVEGTPFAGSWSMTRPPD
ncbi:retroviral-like aspartic protease, partial [bacterium]|nr:retroviral-like aspartic protease [bacterium]